MCLGCPGTCRQANTTRRYPREVGQPRSWAFAAQTKPYNLRETKVIRDLMPEDINQLVSISGMVTRCSSVIPEMQCACGRLRYALLSLLAAL